MNIAQSAVQSSSTLFLVSRPRFWLYLAGPVLVGAAWGADSLAALYSLPVLVLFLYFLVPANLVLYGINDRFDREVDANNPKKGDREIVWQRDPTITGAIVVASAVGVATFYVTPVAAWGYLAGFFLLAVLYSTPPFRLKARPVVDSVANGLYILPGTAMYVTLAGVHPPLVALIGAWLWTMGMHTFSAIPDIDPDRRAGIQTTATTVGVRGALVYCVLCWSATAIVFGSIDLRAGALLSIYPAFLLIIHFGSVSIRRAYWWFPALNTVVGAVLTIAGMWEVVDVPGVIG